MSRTSPRPGGYDKALRGNDWHTFLYLLMRDHLPAGVVEAIVTDIESRTGDGPTAFSNDFLAAYAIEVNARLQGEDPETALARAHAAIRHAQAEPPDELALEVTLQPRQLRPSDQPHVLRTHLVDGEADIPLAGYGTFASIRLRVVRP